MRPLSVGTSASPPSAASATGHIELDVQVVVAALEARVARDADAQEEVARGAAAAPRTALATHAHARAVGDTGGNVDLEAARLAGALAQLDGARGAVVGLLQAHAYRPLDILAARAGGRTGGAAEQPVEEAAEAATTAAAAEVELDALEAAAGAATGAATKAEAARAAAAHLLLDLVGVAPVVAVLVVGGARLGVGQHLVGGADLLEALLGLGVAGVYVRVVLAGELAEGIANVLVRCRTRDAEDRVVVRRHGGSITDCHVRIHTTLVL